MKGITLLLSAFLFLSTLLSSAQDTTLTFRFTHFRVADGLVKDTLIFDVEVKSNTPGTFLWGSQVVLSFNTAVFGTYIANLTGLTKLSLIAPYPYAILKQNTGAGTQLIINITQGPSVDTTILARVPVTYAGLIKLRMLINDNTQNTGVQFDALLMDYPHQKFVLAQHQGLVFSGNSYDPVLYANSLVNLPSTPTVFSLMFSEIGDPSNSAARFVEIYNSGIYEVNFTAYPWFLTNEAEGSGTYNTVQLSGVIPAGGTYVIGSDQADYSSAYGGKNAQQYSNTVITGDGDDSYLLCMYDPFGQGTLIDIFGQNGVDGTGQAWEYTDSHAVRYYSQIAPATTWYPGQWHISPAANIDMTPSSHRATLNWIGNGNTPDEWRDTTNWLEGYVPDIAHNVIIPGNANILLRIIPGVQGYCNNMSISNP
jgi:hypothetical protein